MLMEARLLDERREGVAEGEANANQGASGDEHPNFGVEGHACAGGEQNKLDDGEPNLANNLGDKFSDKRKRRRKTDERRGEVIRED